VSTLGGSTRTHCARLRQPTRSLACSRVLPLRSFRCLPSSAPSDRASQPALFALAPLPCLCPTPWRAPAAMPTTNPSTTRRAAVRRHLARPSAHHLTAIRSSGRGAPSACGRAGLHLSTPSHSSAPLAAVGRDGIVCRGERLQTTKVTIVARARARTRTRAHACTAIGADTCVHMHT
jgi:hypothetical protein